MRFTRRDIIHAAIATATAMPLIEGHAKSPASVPGFCPVVPEKVAEKFRPVPFESQALGGLFEDRMVINIERRLLKIDQDALLAGFLNRNSGKDSRSFVGEHAGKFLDAACNVIRYRENAQLRKMLDRVAKTLVETQEADGYLGTYPLEKRWGHWDVWVHKYNLIGLLSYYELTGDVEVLTACRKMGNLLDRTFGQSVGQRNICSGLHVGMASSSVLEPMCKLYRFTGEKRYLDFCQYIVRAYEHSNGPRIVTALLEHGSVYRTANGKAYEMLSNLNGLLDLYRLTAEERVVQAVLKAWDDIVHNQLYFTGSTSAREHFQPPGQWLTLQSSNVGEMCVTVTWLQLNWRLQRLTGEARFGQEIERSVYNHLFAGQNAHSGDISYYTSFVGRKEHVSSVLCCVSSAPRALSIIPQFVWGLHDDAFVINLFSSGRVQFEMGAVPVSVTSTTHFPSDGFVLLEIVPQRSLIFTLRVRVPEWVHRFEAKVGEHAFKGVPGRMLDITRTWVPSTRVELRMDLPVQIRSGTPGYADCCAIQRGPQIVALEKAVNPAVPYLSRVGIPRDGEVLKLRPIPASTTWGTGPVYETEGVTKLSVGAEGAGKCLLKLVPFADAIDCSVWVRYADRLRSDAPPLSAYMRGRTSQLNLRLQPTDKQKISADVTESLTDENPATYCMADPSAPHLAAQIEGTDAPSDRAQPVWFAVIWPVPVAISRVVFRHGKMSPNGGWFDSSKEMPWVEIVRMRPAVDKFNDMGYLSPESAQWERIVAIDSYPETSAAPLSPVMQGSTFEARLEAPVTVQGVRVVGYAGGDYVTCSELSAFAS